jgi:hypothetical protein
MHAHRCCQRVIHAAIATFLVLAGLGAALAAPADAPDMTEQRNAATGFAITLWMTHVDALGTHCAKLGGAAGADSMRALEAWQDRNMPYVNGALEYMADMEEFISAAQGEAARKSFRADRKAEFVASTRKSEAVWFPDGKVDETSCLHLASLVATGSLDLDQNADFFPVLETLKAEADRKVTR